MCGAACPLLDNFDQHLPPRRNKAVPRGSHNGCLPEAALAVIDGRASDDRCPQLQGVLILDPAGVVNACTAGAARIFGADRSALVGRIVSELIPELKFKASTPGYNVAYALFWFPNGNWRRVGAVVCDGQRVDLDVSVSVVKVEGRHRLLLALGRVEQEQTASDDDLAPMLTLDDVDPRHPCPAQPVQLVAAR